MLKMETIRLFLYIVFAYGLSNLLVYGTGPFQVLVRFRVLARKILETLGDMLDCMMCTSANIGWIVSALNLLFLPVAVTPMLLAYGNSIPWYVTVFGDMCITSGSVWLIHTAQEALERSNSDGRED